MALFGADKLKLVGSINKKQKKSLAKPDSLIQKTKTQHI